MSQTQISQQKDIRTLVSLHTQADGSVKIVATGGNGTLVLNIDGGEDGPLMDIPLLNHERIPGKPYRYKAIWGLEANGQLRGWLAEDEGKIKWFSKPPNGKTRKRPEKGRQVAKSVRKEG